ncbi:hypothetical protein G6F62_005760 [Rhizopus arrhizus]|nr:hypothetical protein G6F62_005760 [Rhizopus arrhizus]KAG1414585.1 hypothetical protein G6F58_006885 [Rhizopus delemar]
MYCREWAQFVYKKHFVWNAKTLEDVNREHPIFANAGRYQIRLIYDEDNLEEQEEYFQKEKSVTLIKKFEELLDASSTKPSQENLINMIAQACREWMTLPSAHSGLPDLFQPVELNSYPDAIPLVDDEQDPSQLLDPLIIERQALCLPSDCFHLLKSMTGDIIISHTSPTCNHRKPTSKTPADLEIDRAILTEHEQVAVKKALDELSTALERVWKPMNVFIERLEEQDKARTKLIGAGCQSTIDEYFASQKYTSFVDHWATKELPMWRKKKTSDEEVKRLDDLVQDHFHRLGALADQFLDEFVTRRFQEIRDWNTGLLNMVQSMMDAMEEHMSSLDQVEKKNSTMENSSESTHTNLLNKLKDPNRIESSESRITAELKKRVDEYKQEIEELLKYYRESSRPSLSSRIDKLNHKDFKKRSKKVESGYYVIRQHFRYEITENIFPESLFGRFVLVCLSPLMMKGEVMEVVTIKEEVQRFVKSHKDLLQERYALLSRFEEGVQTGRKELAGVIGKLLLKEGMRIQGESVALQRQNNLLKTFGVAPIESETPAKKKKSKKKKNGNASGASTPSLQEEPVTNNKEKQSSSTPAATMITKKLAETKKKAAQTAIEQPNIKSIAQAVSVKEEQKKQNIASDAAVKEELKKQPVAQVAAVVKEAKRELTPPAVTEPIKKNGQPLKEERKKQPASSAVKATPVLNQKPPSVPESIKKAAAAAAAAKPVNKASQPSISEQPLQKSPSVPKQPVLKPPAVPESIKKAAAEKPSKNDNQIPTTIAQNVTKTPILSESAPNPKTMKPVESKVNDNEWTITKSKKENDPLSPKTEITAKDKAVVDDDIKGWADIVASITDDSSKEEKWHAPELVPESKDTAVSDGWDSVNTSGGYQQEKEPKTVLSTSTHKDADGWGTTQPASTNTWGDVQATVAENTWENTKKNLSDWDSKEETKASVSGWNETEDTWNNMKQDVKKPNPEWRRKDNANSEWRAFNNSSGNTESKAKGNEENLGSWGTIRTEGWGTNKGTKKDNWSSLRKSNENLESWSNSPVPDGWESKSSRTEESAYKKTAAGAGWGNSQVPWENNSSESTAPNKVERNNTLSGPPGFSKADPSAAATMAPPGFNASDSSSTIPQANASKPPGLSFGNGPVNTMPSAQQTLSTPTDVSSNAGLPFMNQTSFIPPLNNAAQLQEPLPPNVDEFGKDMLLLMVKNLHRENSTLINTVYTLQQDMAMMNKRYTEVMALAREREAQTVQLIETRKQTEIEKAKAYVISLESRIKELEEQARQMNYQDRPTAGFGNQDLFAGYREEMRSTPNNNNQQGRNNNRKLWSKTAVVRCGNCGETGHSSTDCKSYCRYCGSLEHLSESCPMN